MNAKWRREALPEKKQQEESRSPHGTSGENSTKDVGTSRAHVSFPGSAGLGMHLEEKKKDERN